MEYRSQLTEDFIQSLPTTLDYIPNVIITPFPSSEITDEAIEMLHDEVFEDESEVFEQENEVFEQENNEVYEKENDEPFENNESGYFEDPDIDKDIWLTEPTKYFISRIEDLLPKVGKTLGLKNKTKMWELIHKDMVGKGYRFTLSQIKGKYRSLERRYKKTKLNNSKTGRNRITCPFESELDKIFEKRRGLHPEFILHSRDIEGKTRKELVGDDASQNIPCSSGSSGCSKEKSSGASQNSSALLRTSSSIVLTKSSSGSASKDISSPSTSSSAMQKTSWSSTSDIDEDQSPVKKKRTNQSSNQDKLLKRLDEIAEERKEYHSQIKQYIQAKEEREKEMLNLLRQITAKGESE